MKKVFCLMKYYLNPEEGSPFPKFDYQISALKNMGYDVYFLALDGGFVYLCNDNNKQLIRKITYNKFSEISLILIYDAIYKAAEEVFKNEIKFDYAYIRAMPSMPSCVKAFKQIKQTDCKVIVEIPTYPSYKEINKEKRITRRLFYKFTNKYSLFLSEYVDLYTLIGEFNDEYLNKPAINIINGINIDVIPPRIPYEANDDIHLIGIASMADWHGYDRLIQGLSDYYKNDGKEMIYFHLVGNDADGSLANWRVLSETLDMQKHVLFEGPIYGKSLTDIINQSDIGIASLGCYRKGFTNTSELKIREYMARGLPFIYSTPDSAIQPGLDYCLKVSNDDSPIDIKTVIQFAKSIYDNQTTIKTMRNYAKENMSWESQFKLVFDKINTL